MRRGGGEGASRGKRRKKAAEERQSSHAISLSNNIKRPNIDAGPLGSTVLCCPLVRVVHDNTRIPCLIECEQYKSTRVESLPRKKHAHIHAARYGSFFKRPNVSGNVRSCERTDYPPPRVIIYFRRRSIAIIQVQRRRPACPSLSPVFLTRVHIEVLHTVVLHTGV